MGLFEDLCKGPAIVVDDRIDVAGDPIGKLVQEIKSRKLPILTYKSISEIREVLGTILFCNFFILDWKMVGGQMEVPPEVQPGAEAEDSWEQEVIELIRQIQKVSLAPIFVLSAYDTDEITSRLQNAGVKTGGTQSVFVVSKNTVCQNEGALVSKIEGWIKGSPHVYLAKWWTNEWLVNNTRVFWDLCESNPDWPAWFYRSFKQDGDEPILALRDTLFRLILSDTDVSSVNELFLDKDMGTPDDDTLESLKRLYMRLVYTSNNINRDIRPGDIFKKDDSYYLNIRPECDTASPAIRDPKLYLLKGDKTQPSDPLTIQYQEQYGVIPKEYQIVMHFLDGNDIVVFDKRKLSVKEKSKLRGYTKICRVVEPFITQARHSFSSFLGRFGVPRYPKQIIDSLFECNPASPESEE